MMESATAPVGASVTPMPAGSHQFVLVDGINMGMRVEDYEGKNKRLSPKYAFVFQSTQVNPETGERWLLVHEVTLSMGEKANLRKLVEGWLGQKMTDEQAEKFDVASLYLRNGIASVMHKPTSSGKVYARLQSITGLMPGMPTASAHNYQRPEYLLERRAEYAKEAAEFAAKEGVSAGMTTPGFPSPTAGGVAASGPAPAPAPASATASTGPAIPKTAAEAKAIIVSGSPLGSRTNEELMALHSWAAGKGNARLEAAADLIMTERNEATKAAQDFDDFPSALADGDDDLPF